MTIHATLLNQLEAFEAKFGVNVVPRKRVGGEDMRMEIADDDMFPSVFVWSWTDPPEIEEPATSHDAHAHIREGSRKAVEWWCLKYRGGMCITPHDGIAITAWDTGRTLGHGPTTEDALSGALETILKEKA